MRTHPVLAGWMAILAVAAPMAAARSDPYHRPIQALSTPTAQNDDQLPPPVARRPRLGLSIGVAGGDLGGLLGSADVTAPGLGLARGFDGRVEYDDFRSGVLWGSGDRRQGRAFTFSQVSATSPLYYGAGMGFLSTDRGGATTQDYCARLLVGVNVTRFFGLEADLVVSTGPSVLSIAGRFRL